MTPEQHLVWEFEDTSGAARKQSAFAAREAVGKHDQNTHGFSGSQISYQAIWLHPITNST